MPFLKFSSLVFQQGTANYYMKQSFCYTIHIVVMETCGKKKPHQRAYSTGILSSVISLLGLFELRMSESSRDQSPKVYFMLEYNRIHRLILEFLLLVDSRVPCLAIICKLCKLRLNFSFTPYYLYRVGFYEFSVYNCGFEMLI